MADASYRLESDGDALEKRSWVYFLKRDFPSYERYWLRFVVPLTKRPRGIGLRTEAELAAIGRGDHDACLAQLHYTVLTHLAAAYDLQQGGLGPDEFVCAMVRLSAAGDVAHEFLGRIANADRYDPWSEGHGATARYEWRRKHPDLNDLHDYRNRLLHGRVPMVLLGHGGIHLYPKLGEKIGLDWRDVTERFNPARDLSRFETAQNVVSAVWEVVVTYLETNWQSVFPQP